MNESTSSGVPEARLQTDVEKEDEFFYGKGNIQTGGPGLGAEARYWDLDRMFSPMLK